MGIDTGSYHIQKLSVYVQCVLHVQKGCAECCVYGCLLFVTYSTMMSYSTSLRSAVPLEAVGQETEEAVVPISDTHSNRPAPRSTANMYVGNLIDNLTLFPLLCFVIPNQ